MKRLTRGTATVAAGRHEAKPALAAQLPVK